MKSFKQINKIMGKYLVDSSYDGRLYRFDKDGSKCTIVASNGLGWEHVSISFQDRCPTWEEMCYYKNVFWNKDETVVQFQRNRNM